MLNGVNCLYIRVCVGPLMVWKGTYSTAPHSTEWVRWKGSVKRAQKYICIREQSVADTSWLMYHHRDMPARREPVLSFPFRHLLSNAIFFCFASLFIARSLFFLLMRIYFAIHMRNQRERENEHVLSFPLSKQSTYIIIIQPRYWERTMCIYLKYRRAWYTI